MIEQTEITNLIAKFLSGEATPDEAIMLEDWKVMSDENQHYFERCCLVYAHRVIELKETDFLDAKRKVKRSLHVISTIKRKRKIQWRTGIAASLVLLVITAVLLYRSPVTDMPVYAAGSSARKIDLGSSEVLLSAGSSLTVTGQGSLQLKGSASFSVRHDTLHPLIVKTGALFVKDVGTRFTIVSVPNEEMITVEVQEGEVSLYDNHGNTENIYAGEKAIYIAATKKIEILGRNKNLPRPAKPLSKTDEIEKTPITVPADTAKGTVLFDCSKCAARGQLQFIYSNTKDTVKSDFSFFKTWSPTVNRHIEVLKAGEYKWFYSDAQGNKTDGRLTVIGNKEQIIRLLEP